MSHPRPASFDDLRALGERKPAPERATHMERHRAEVREALAAVRHGVRVSAAGASALCVEVRTLRAALRQCAALMRGVQREDYDADALAEAAALAAALGEEA